MLEVNLAGYNIDKDSLDHIKYGLSPLIERHCDRIEEAVGYIDPRILKFSDDLKKELESLTPETICASYARISRDERSIPELRKDSRSDVEKARKSNQAIIFSMGHKSIAEHAQFNFDIMGLSRKAVETLERKRLCSYTEKSQRYITLQGDYVIPQEIKGTKFEKQFKDLIENKQNKFYSDNLEKLQEWHANQPGLEELFKQMGITKEKDKIKNIEGWGKEDARYAVAMATEAQLGLTISARNLETLITELRSSSIIEEQELGRMLNKEIDHIAPSVIKYTNPTDYFTKTRKELKQLVNELSEKYFITDPKKNDSKRSIIYTNLNTDQTILAGLIFSSSNFSFQESYNFARRLKKHNQKEIIKKSIEYKEKHDPMLREYELDSRITQMVMSSSAFAQMKRHRMDTIISQDYNLDLGVTIPDSIKGIKKEKEFMEIIKDTEEFYKELKSYENTKEIADYVLTNAHKRRILFCANNRQIHAFASERENLYAQWDIRKTANEYVKEMKTISPLTLGSACGKHEYDKVKQNVLNQSNS